MVLLRFVPIGFVLFGGCCIDPSFERRIREQAIATFAYDVEHYALEIAIDPVARSIEGLCRVRIWHARHMPGFWPADWEFSSIEEVRFDFDAFEIRSLEDRAGRPLRWRREDEALTVALETPLERDHFEEITIRYAGRPLRGLWFTRIRDGLPTQVYTHGQCDDARGWFPCHDFPSERATSELAVTMPRAWTSIAAGERVERVEHGDQATERWRTTFPHPSYLETLVCGELVLEHDEWDGTPLVYAAAPEHAAFLRETFQETPRVLQFLSERTGVRYPYPKYAETCVDDFPFGGMENVSATTLTDTILPDAQGLPDLAERDLIAHEAAHQWFGNLVTCVDWGEAWLNEGFATYFAALYEEHVAGRDAFEVRMRAIRDHYLARDQGANVRPIASGTGLEGFFSGHVYEGAAIRLHHLRGLVGDEAFFAGVRGYLATRMGGWVHQQHLLEALEAASGHDLGGHFRQWFDCAGHPCLRSTWTWHRRGKLELQLEQTAPRSSSATSIFAFELDVEVATARGTRVQRLRIDRPLANYSLPCDDEPLWVRIDPRDLVPMELDERMSTHSWLALAEHGDTSGRLRALGVLSRGRGGALREKEVGVVEDLLLRLGAEDESPYVRSAAIEALARSLTAEKRASARELFLHAARRDADRDVRATAFRALRTFGRDADLHAFAADALARTEGWSSRVAVVGLLASSAPERAHEILLGELETASAHGLYEARILALLRSTGDPRARGVLGSWLRDESKPDEARAIALRELALSHLQPAEVESAIGLLESPRIRLRREAVAALGTTKDPRARAALERHLASAPSEIERVSAEDVLDRSIGEP